MSSTLTVFNSFMNAVIFRFCALYVFDCVQKNLQDFIVAKFGRTPCEKTTVSGFPP